MKTNYVVTLFTVISSITMTSVFAADPPPGATKPAVEEPAYFGVITESAHPALAANLKHLLKPDQGLSVEVVAEESPASKAGVKVHDILTSYDNQKLFSAEQFVKLVRSDRPGREVSVEYLRGGKLEKLQVTLGKLDITDIRAWTPSERSQPYRFGRPDRVPRRFIGQPTPAYEWDNFDSLTLKKLGVDKFHVELQYLDKDGKLQKQVFEGSRDEIHKAIEAEKSLKPVERAHLLRGLNLRSPEDETPFPHIWFEPGNGWFFEQPGGAFH